MHFAGSKNGSGVKERIISEMPPHDVFIEPFAGTGIIGRTKKHSRLHIYNDIDPAAPIFSALKRNCSAVAVDRIPNPTIPAGNYIKIDADRIDRITDMAGNIVMCGDAISQLRALIPAMPADTLIYIDAPYLGYVRSYNRRSYYKYEMKTQAEHEKLLDFVKALPFMVMISHYDCFLYAAVLNDWRRIYIPTVNRGGKRVMETVWMNFPEPFIFHDTRFLGQNFRERERIKRKKLRWIKRLSNMSRLDRASILDAIDVTRSAWNRNAASDGARSMNKAI